jgi:general secretion pathway protein L
MARDIAIDGDTVHLAIGEADADGGRPVAMVSAAMMELWLGSLRARGFDPAVIVPASLLLAAPADGISRCAIGAISFCRGPREAFCLEHSLADHVCSGKSVIAVDEATFRLGIPAQLAQPRINLRQSAFAAARSAGDRPLGRRAAWLAAGALAAAFLAEAAPAVRDLYAAHRLEDKARMEAAALLPHGQVGDDPGEALRLETARLGGGRSRFSAEAAALFAAVAEVGGSEIGAIQYRGGRIEAVIRAESAAPIEALSARLRRYGYEPEISPLPQDRGLARWTLKVQAP